MKQLLTIIIPTHNSALFFSETLRHLSEQSEKRFKVLIIDDNSTDQTKSICEKYAGKLSLDFIVKSKKIRRGAAASINYALKKVDTEYFALIDSDAFLESNWVCEMLKALKKYRIAGAPIFAVQNAGIIAYVCGLEIEARYDRLNEGQLRHLSTCNLAGRRELIGIIRLDESLNYAYDHQLSFQLKQNGILFFLTKKNFLPPCEQGRAGKFFYATVQNC